MARSFYQIYLRHRLSRAIVHGNLRRCQSYVEKGAPLNNQPNDRGLTPLQLAIANNRPSIVTYLLNAGAIQTPLPVSGVSCLLFAIGLWRSHVYVICQALLEDGIPINQNGVCDALYIAMLKRDTALVQLLLDHGASRTDPRVHSAITSLQSRAPNHDLLTLFTTID